MVPFELVDYPVDVLTVRTAEAAPPPNVLHVLDGIVVLRKAHPPQLPNLLVAGITVCRVRPHAPHDVVVVALAYGVSRKANPEPVQDETIPQRHLYGEQENKSRPRTRDWKAGHLAAPRESR